ncbi:MAG: alpha/beta hydrolase [Chloroflexota bacterium]|nr:alpha/beta hydrolase [Chloroflexota bacterium]
MDAVIVLIHSPLVGPLTWSLVADELRRRGVGVAVPTLVDAGDGGPPFWEQHAAAVARGVGAVPAEASLVLVGHSGAGPLLPTVGQRVGHPVAAYVFVDAGIPADGESRLDVMATEDPAFAAELRRHLEAGGCFPEWREEDLRAAIPDPPLRRRTAEELQPRPLAFFGEPIPVPAGWPDAPCGYLKFSAAYDQPAERARREGWAYREVDGGHFHLLVDPPAVTEALLDLVEHLVGPPTTKPRPTSSP